MSVAFDDRAGAVTEAERRRYLDEGFWRAETLGEIIAGNATRRPDRSAFVGSGWSTSWAEHDRLATGIAHHLLDVGLRPGARIAVVLPDSPLGHAAYTAIERAGMITVGIGPRAGVQRQQRAGGAAGGPPSGTDRAAGTLV